MNFEFFTATRIVFGPGCYKSLDHLITGIGKSALVVSGSSDRFIHDLLEVLRRKCIAAHRFQVSREPSVNTVREGVQFARESECDFIIGLGGGSVIDAAKAISVMLTNEGDILDYIEVVGTGKKIKNPSLPCIAIPTTSGTGAEVTVNAVLEVPEHRIKASLRSPFLATRIAVVDPELTLNLPPKITAYTGMDALTQLIEPYTSKLSNPLINPLCREGIRRVSNALKRAYDSGDDLSAREDMSFASLIGGLALANAKLGAVHGFAGPIGGMYRAPHGAICARLLPYVMEINVRALMERGDKTILSRYEDIAKILTQNDRACIQDGIAWIQELNDTFEIPPLSACGVMESDFPFLIERAAKASSMRGNPIELTNEEMLEILTKATYSK